MTWIVDAAALAGIALIGAGAAHWGWHVSMIAVGCLLLALSQAYSWRLLSQNKKG